MSKLLRIFALARTLTGGAGKNSGEQIGGAQMSKGEGESVNAPAWKSESLWRGVRFSSLSVPDDYLKQLDVCSRRLPQARTGSSTLLPPNNGSRVGCIVETGYP